MSTHVQEAAATRYARNVCTSSTPSLALAILELWDRPWSSRAMRFAAHAMIPAVRRGIDVLEVK